MGRQRKEEQNKKRMTETELEMDRMEHSRAGIVQTNRAKWSRIKQNGV
jgi:hypothetical protein